MIPPLSPEEYALLEANIGRDGCLEPLCLWDDTLIDGHNRRNICTKLHIPYKVTRLAAAKPKALEGKYRILYVDPPWKYIGLNQADEYGHAERHYDCLSDEQLIAYKPDGRRTVKEMADNNSVLFIWVTSPMLERCFPIIRAWGFSYKSSFVWDKIKHNMGHYTSVRHEFLLIATKGSCTPDVKKLHDSVVSIKRTEHSRKPKEFRSMIERMYNHGRKLQLFSREAVPDWDMVGNEI